MSHDALQVTTTHLRELAARHGRAAAELTSATAAVCGADTRIRRSHGMIAWSTAAAVEALQHARQAAGHDVAAHSRTLGDDLTATAHRYETTDEVSADRLDARMRPR